MEETHHLQAIWACALFFLAIYGCVIFSFCNWMQSQVQGFLYALVIWLMLLQIVFHMYTCQHSAKNTKKSACGLLQNIKSACINPICNITAYYSLTNLHFNQFRCVLIKSLVWGHGGHNSSSWNCWASELVLPLWRTSRVTSCDVHCW